MNWDLDYDVVIAGYGYAGGWAAIEAHDAGSRVAIFEKMPNFGGNSILSGGGFSYATDYEGALAYLRATCLDATDDDVLQAYAQGMVELGPYIKEFAAEVGFEVVDSRQGATYRFPGHESFATVRVTRNENYKGFSWTNSSTAGATLFWVLHQHVERRNITQHYNAPVQQLITDETGAVTGVVVEKDGQKLNVRARRGVILATGGYEHNARLIAHYMQIRHAYSMSPLGNTGDGVLMAQKVGAALWHMWHVHGNYGFKVPDFPVAIRIAYGGFRPTGQSSENAQKMPWIALDRFGRRFMNEWPRAAADTPIRDLEYYDFELLDYPRIPAILLFDEDGRKRGPIGVPKANDADLKDFTWSDDNLEEVRKGYIVQFDSLQEVAKHWNMDPKQLIETVNRWNHFCEQAVDADFARTPATMMPIKKPPYYSIEAWPVISNTQGGPVHDAQQRVLDPYGNPIPRLYEAGELGSIWGHVYLLSGNIVECIVGGRIAGRLAAAEPIAAAEHTAIAPAIEV